MAIPMIGYDVSYERLAFRTKIDSEGVHTTVLELLLERAIKFVQEQSDGRWIISNKAVVMSSDRTKPVELTVLVPAGSDQYQQMLAAVKAFEDRVVVWLTDYPFDTTLRTIEEDEPQCKVCSKKPDWVRHAQPGRDDYFCTSHAQSAYDFFAPTRPLFWEQLEPATT